MRLSVEERAALRAKAEELRTEVTALSAERDAALTDQAQTVEDAKLIAEVQSLESRRVVAEQQRDAAVSTTEDAIAKMMELAGESRPVVAGAELNDKTDGEPEATAGEEAPKDEPSEEVLKPELVIDEKPASTRRGGSR